VKTLDIKKYPGFRSISLLCLFILYAPMLVISVYSFNALRSITNWGGFTFDWYVKAFNNPTIQIATFNSLLIASVAAVISTAIAISAALALSRSGSFKGKSTAFAFINLPLMIPEIVTAVASLVFFIAIGFDLGLLTILIAHIVFCIPFAYLPISARLQGINGSFEEAAQDLYASKWQSFRFVLLPMLMPGIISGMMLAFIVSLDDFIITNMVAGPGATTLPLAIYGMVRVGFTPEINAISTLLLLISLVFVTISYFAGHSAPKIKKTP
jgi:spermidine/putrescine transport system permease protein